MGDSETKNFLIVFPVLIGIGLAAFYLYQDYHAGPTNEEDAISRETIGEVLYAENNVKRQFTNELMWNAIDKKGPVYNRDSIRTGKDSTVGLKLNDSTIIEVGENSLIVLDKSQQNFNINFKAGDLTTKNSGQAMQIQVKDSVIKGAGSELKIKSGADDKASIEVAKGKATLTDKNHKSVEVKEAEVAGLDDSGVPTVHKIAVFLRSPENKTQLQSNSPEVHQPFTWSVTDLKNEQFEISKSGSFKQGFTRVYKAHQAVTAVIPQGVSYWRVGWLEGGKMLYTETRQISVNQDKRIELTFPENDTHFEFEPDEDTLDLQWKSQINGKIFVVDVSTSTDFRNLVSTQTLKQEGNAGKINIKNLPSHTYFWRVKVFGDRNDELAVSPVNLFVLKVKLPFLPELIKPGPDATWIEPSPVSFSWKKMEKAKDYRITIFSDPDRREITKTKTGPEQSFSWRWRNQQTYYWNVTALSPSAAIIGQSDTRKLSIQTKVKTPPFNLLNPKDRAIILREMTENPDPILFQWQILRPLPGPVTLTIAPDESFKDAVKQDNLTKLSIPVVLKKPGTYFWKLTSVSPTDKDNMESSETASFTLKHNTNLLGPQLIEPANKDKIEIAEPVGIKFTWKPVLNAVQYHIVVGRVDITTGDNKSVMDRIVKETTITSNPLPEGNYVWTVSSMDSEGQEGIPAKAREFVVMVQEEMAAPKLNAPVIK